LSEQAGLFLPNNFKFEVIPQMVHGDDTATFKKTDHLPLITDHCRREAASIQNPKSSIKMCHIYPACRQILPVPATAIARIKTRKY
jgi:hypothetical protein